MKELSIYDTLNRGEEGYIKLGSGRIIVQFKKKAFSMEATLLYNLDGENDFLTVDTYVIMKNEGKYTILGLLNLLKQAIKRNLKSSDTTVIVKTRFIECVEALGEVRNEK